MIRIGIICGNGLLPLHVGRNLIKENYQIFFLRVKNYTNAYDYKGYEHTEIEINSFSNILKLFKLKNIDQIIMVGKISRPSIRDIKFDLNTISLIKDYFLESKGDDQLLRSISKFFENKGYPLFEWKKVCSDLFSSEDNLTANKPSTSAMNNLKKGLDIFRLIGKADIGQSLVIQNQLILGVECLEGTDELIQRCSYYKKSKDKKIIMKLSKYNQHNELDLPTIGIKTFENLKKFNYEGVFIEKNNCIIIEKNKIINFCNENNLFLSSVNKIE